MHPVLFIVFLPLIAAIVAGLFGRWIGKTAAKAITTGSLFIGAFLSWPIFLSYIGGSAGPVVVPVLDWIRSGSLTVDWALRVDALTSVMLVVVTSVSSLVHLYSWGYMQVRFSITSSVPTCSPASARRSWIRNRSRSD